MNTFGAEAKSFNTFGALSLEPLAFTAAGLRTSPDSGQTTSISTASVAPNPDASARFPSSADADADVRVASASLGLVADYETHSECSSGCEAEADAMADAASVSGSERESVSLSPSSSYRADASSVFLEASGGGSGSVGCAQVAVGGQGVPASVHVGNVAIRNVPLVSLAVGGRLRVCLAQLSSTLLRDFSYNEIHNRRVALGINCVQCNPMHLELLRRAGAMPSTSRRCGMITVREAERLVKSFVEGAAPTRLPEGLVFGVAHECGFGCSGLFVPARYNSSRAKCVRCERCVEYFSPNKFIFHWHTEPPRAPPRVPLATDCPSGYRHPDAANFNAWRRHLHLSDPNASEETVHKWEDVKAMFNGGNRKRASAVRRSTRQVSAPASAAGEAIADTKGLSEDRPATRNKSTHSIEVDDSETSSAARRSQCSRSGAANKRRSSRAQNGGGSSSKRNAGDLVTANRSENYSTYFISDQHSATTGRAAGALGCAGATDDVTGHSLLGMGLYPFGAAFGGGAMAIGSNVNSALGAAANNVEEEVRAEYVRAALERFVANALQMQTQMYRTQTQTQTLSQMLTPTYTEATAPHFPLPLPPLARPHPMSGASPDCQPLANAVGLLANFNTAYALLDGARVMKAPRSTPQVASYSIESLINTAVTGFH